MPTSFAAWRDGFRSRALAQGIRPQVFDAAFAGVGENAEVVRLDGRQAEFTKPIWEYLDGAASSARVEAGRARRQQLGPTLAAIERSYGVDGDVVLAIWGMETNYGSNRGSMPVIESLATLAYEGRRRDFAEEQLIAALRIIQAGDIAPGAHGRVVGRGDGPHPVHADELPRERRRLHRRRPPRRLGRGSDRRARLRRELPRQGGVAARRALGHGGAGAGGLQLRHRPTSRTAARPRTGARAASPGSTARPLPDHGPAAILAPAGARGPAFAVYENFFVIKTYNNATSYAMGVGHLGDRIAGGGSIAGAWPRHERELSRTEKIELQRRLVAQRLRHRHHRRRDRPEHHHRDPGLAGRRRPDPRRLRHRLALAAAALMAERPPRLAVLIDADNTSPKVADGLFDEVAKIGEASLRRIYGDFSKGQQAGWEKVLARHAILPFQQFAYTTGKNSTDITLVIDAMDLLHTGRFDGFCLVSSDSDFTRLAARIREQGVDVYGIGQAKTPEAFRQACTRFIFTENFVRETGAPAAAKTALRPMGEATALIDKALEAMEEDAEGWFQLGAVGQRLQNLSPEFDTRTFGHGKLSDLVEATGRFELRSGRPARPAAADEGRPPQEVAAPGEVRSGSEDLDRVAPGPVRAQEGSRPDPKEAALPREAEVEGKPWQRTPSRPAPDGRRSADRPRWPARSRRSPRARAHSRRRRRPGSRPVRQPSSGVFRRRQRAARPAATGRAGRFPEPRTWPGQDADAAAAGSGSAPAA